jgi:hypothetical protein
MALFIIVSIPVWFLLIVSFYRAPSRGWRGLFLPFLGGLAVGVAALLLTLGVLSRTPFGIRLPELYRWAWFRGPGLPFALVVPVLLAVYLPRPTSFSRIRELAAWMCGTVFVYTIWYAITPDPGFDGYRLFFAPLLWIGAVGSTAWLLDRGLAVDGWLRYLLFAAAGIFPSLQIFYPVLYTMGELFYAYSAVIVVAALSTFLIFLDSRGRIRRP